MRILVLGAFSNKQNQLDGQTVKTRSLYELISKQINEDIKYHDTSDFKTNKFTIFIMLWKVIRCDTLVYLPAQNNLKYIFPIIYLLSTIFSFRIHYFVVGGWLRDYISNLSLHRKMLSRISGIHVETKRLKNELEKHYKYNNVDIFPNFRFFDFKPSHKNSDKLRLVFMARINKMKGLDWIFNLADNLIVNKIDDKYSITFYGPINEEDKEYFEYNINKYKFVEYKGVLQPNEIYRVLSNYDVMLFPTHYYTEGLPGSIVDAYISGIPVIVTEWMHSHEFVENNYSGYIIPFVDGESQLFNHIVELENNRMILQKLKNNVMKKRTDFLPPKNINDIINNNNATKRNNYKSPVSRFDKN